MRLFDFGDLAGQLEACVEVDAERVEMVAAAARVVAGVGRVPADVDRLDQVVRFSPRS